MKIKDNQVLELQGIGNSKITLRTQTGKDYDVLEISGHSNNYNHFNADQIKLLIDFLRNCIDDNLKICSVCGRLLPHHPQILEIVYIPDMKLYGWITGVSGDIVYMIIPEQPTTEFIPSQLTWNIHVTSGKAISQHRFKDQICPINGNMLPDKVLV